MDPEDLFKSCFANDLLSVQEFLIKGYSINFQDDEGVTPLQIAASQGYTDLVTFLLENDAKVDLANNYGWTPLMHAARLGNTAIVALLLKKKAKVNICNKLGLRPIVAAAWSGQLSTIKLLIEAGAIVNHMPSQNKQEKDCDLSSLMAASIQGHDSVLRFLLEKGAAVNQASPVTDLTPLMLASCNGHKQIVQVIVEWGGDANKTDICNQTALDIATSRSKCEVKAYLENMTLTKFSSEQLRDKNIFQAVRSGDDHEVESILQLDSHTANIIDPCDGSTPLMLASMLGHVNIVHLLISNGTNLDSQDTANGWTAVMHAVFHRHGEIVALLVEAGANIYVRSLNGYTALDLARHLGGSETDIINILTSNRDPTKHCMKIKNLSTTMQLSGLSTMKKSCENDRRTRKSNQSTRFKGWIDEVSQKFHQRMFSRVSDNSSTTMPIPPDIQISDANDDVFLDSNSTQTTLEQSKLSISSLLSPNKRLSSSLRKHSVEAISPPLLSTSNSDMDMVRRLSSVNSSDKTPKKKVFLQTPNILKAYYRKSGRESKSVSSCANETFKRPFSNQGQINKCQSSSNKIAPKLSQNDSSDVFTSGHHQTTSNLTQLLSKESLQKYVEKFREQEVDLEAFKCLTKNDLQEIGINSFNSQNKLLKMINQMHKNE